MRLTEAAVVGCLAMSLIAQGCGNEEARTDESEEKVASPSKSQPGSGETTPGSAKAKDAPPPDDVYEGNARVINLVWQDGKPSSVDVKGREGNGPQLV